MADVKFTELTAGTVDATSVFAQAKSNQSEQVTGSQVANYVGTSHTFAGLDTTSKNLVGAINEAASSGGATVVQKTQAEYDALTSTEKLNGTIYKITDKAKIYCLDEEYHAIKELTQAQYDALSSTVKNNGTQYIITDAATDASEIPCTVTGLTSTNVADALAEILAMI